MPSDDQYENIWDEVVSNSTWEDISDRTEYSEREEMREHLDIFQDMVPDDFNHAQELQMWADYLEGMVEGGMTQDQFFDLYDIDRADFDWDAWREAMGY